jgi:hypothetical protein
MMILSSTGRDSLRPIKSPASAVLPLSHHRADPRATFEPIISKIAFGG